MSEQTLEAKAALLNERRKKLAEWKKQRQEKLKKQEQTAVADEHVKPITDSSTQQKVKRKRLTFDDDLVTDKVPNSASSEVRKDFPSIELKFSDDVDSLDHFMVNLDTRVPKITSTATLTHPENDLVNIASAEEDSDSDSPFKNHTSKKKRKRKIVTRIGFSKLVPFAKNLYQEPEELKALSEEEVAELRLSLDNISVEGSGFVPRPITKWSHLGLTSDIMDVITKDLKFNTPTPIQAQAIPCIMSGRDVLGISKTGSGKTVSYLLPLLRQIKQQRKLSKSETGPIGLILSPTRELALQIHEEVERFTPPTVKSIVCTGGGELKDQISTIKKGVHIVVATPGRFIDLVTINSGNLMKTNRISMVVLDESDRLFDMGFGPQVKNIMRGIRKDRQCVLFSATFPDSLQNFASIFLQNPLSITINSKNVVNENIQQRCTLFPDERAKFEGFTKLLMVDQNPSMKTVVFVSSQDHCDQLYEKLLDRNLDSEYEVFSIHAGQSSNDRTQNLRTFRQTERKSVLICTEILSRGLNIPEIDLVIVYDAIKAFPQYVHTTGRTARTSSKTGVAHTLLLHHDCDLAASYILYKSMRQNELESMGAEGLEKLTEMYKKFESGLKSGKYQIVQGLGGRGLDNMSKKLINNLKDQQKQVTGEDGDGEDSDNEDETGVTEAEMTLKYEVESVAGVTTGQDAVTYRCQININDFPQLVRWEMTKNETLMSVKRETGTSITTRGKYYDTDHLLKQGEEPKLFLLLENKNESDLTEAISILQAACKSGYRKHMSNESKKFSI